MAEIARIPFNKFYGGLAESDKIGIEGSFAFGQSLDIRSDIKKLQVLPKTTRETNVFTDLVHFIDTNTVNTNIYAVGSAGKLYKKASGTWTLLQTLGGANGQGLRFFKGTSLYYGVSGDNIFSIGPSSSSASQGLQSLDSATWHPCETFLDKVFFASDRQITSYDGSGIYATSSTQGAGITVDYGYSIRVLKDIGDFLFIGAEHVNSSKAKWFLWDGTSSDYLIGKELGEDGIQACCVDDTGGVIVIAGKKGNLYKLSGKILTPLQTIPNIESDKYVETYPGSATTWQGRPYFSPSFGTSETVEKGAYNFTRASRNFPVVLNYEHISSSGETTGSTLDIGCLFGASSTDMYMSWDNNGTFGLDIIDGSGAYATAQYESLIFDDNNPFQQKTFLSFKVRLARTLRTGEKITLKRKADRASTFTSIGDIDFASDGAVIEKTFKGLSSTFKATEVQFQLLFTIIGSTSPAIDSLMAEFSTEGTI